jgi:regulator of replication initiation timing
MLKDPKMIKKHKGMSARGKNKPPPPAARQRGVSLSPGNTTTVIRSRKSNSGNSENKGYDDEDSSTWSSSRAEDLEATIDKVTMENTALLKENAKLRLLWQREKQEKEQLHKRVMRKALQTVTMEKETYAKVKKCATEQLFRVVKFITSEKELRDLESPNSIANHVMDELNIEEEDRIAWWAVYNVAVTDGITDRRNHINTNMKKWVLRKCSIMKWLAKPIMNTNNLT